MKVKSKKDFPWFTSPREKRDFKKGETYDLSEKLSKTLLKCELVESLDEAVEPVEEVVEKKTKDTLVTENKAIESVSENKAVEEVSEKKESEENTSYAEKPKKKRKKAESEGK